MNWKEINRNEKVSSVYQSQHMQTESKESAILGPPTLSMERDNFDDFTKIQRQFPLPDVPSSH